jgi:hypothetical protein
MTKPFLFIETTITVSDGSQIESWELINVGDSSIMHAAWNPEKELLVCQFDSVKETIVPYPMVAKNGKTTLQDKRVDQYYRITFTDKAAVKYILDNLCMNYTNQKWDIKHVSQISENHKQEVSDLG